MRHNRKGFQKRDKALPLVKPKFMKAEKTPGRVRAALRSRLRRERAIGWAKHADWVEGPNRSADYSARRMSAAESIGATRITRKVKDPHGVTREVLVAFHSFTVLRAFIGLRGPRTGRAMSEEERQAIRSGRRR